MLRTTKNMKEKYESIQNYMFTLIPEKWEEIYLYASVYKKERNSQSGELFFYYLPKGILRRKFVNVYEVPKKFNINEEQYLRIVEELYTCIKSLRQDFIDTEQKIWTNITISISNFKFKVEYGYEKLPITEKEIFERNVIWKYKYLKTGGEGKEERKILNQYFSIIQPDNKNIYETGLYIKTENNNIGFDKDDNCAREFVMYEKDEILNKANSIKNRFFSNTINAKNKNKNKSKNINKEEKEESIKKSKNQILDD